MSDAQIGRALYFSSHVILHYSLGKCRWLLKKHLFCRGLQRLVTAVSTAPHMLTLVHAFVTSQVDQCNAVLSGATKLATDTLQRVMNAVAHVVSETRKFEHGLTQILHDDLHRLDVADRVTYKLGVIMHRCWHGKAPQYLVDCCTPVTDVVGRQRLRSTTQQMMVVPRHRLSTVGRQAFTVQGPMVWKSLPDDLRAQQDYESFRQRLKTWLFSSY